MNIAQRLSKVEKAFAEQIGAQGRELESWELVYWHFSRVFGRYLTREGHELSNRLWRETHPNGHTGPNLFMMTEEEREAIFEEARRRGVSYYESYKEMRESLPGYPEFLKYIDMDMFNKEQNCTLVEYWSIRDKQSDDCLYNRGDYADGGKYGRRRK